MLEEEKLAVDEANRVAQHENIKSEVRDEMRAEVAKHAKPNEERDKQRAAVMGEHLKEKAIGELQGTEKELDRARVAARISQVIDYVFYVIYGLIGLEIVLELLGAREGNAFKEFVDAVSAPLLAPFTTLMPDLARSQFQLKLSYIVAMLVYILLHLGINGLLRMMVHRKTSV
jgi:uncharacterized protein YggT (Ycf19 family)